jgi:hypothetical protein
MPVFTTIAFGMCAYLSTGVGAQNRTLVMIGEIEMGVCNPMIFLPDSHGQKAMINGHEIGADVSDNGAKLYFDGKIFYFVKDSI